jgi:hypothetical protein
MGQNAINAGKQMVHGAEKWLTENPKAAMALGALAVVGGIALTVATGGLAGVVIGGALVGGGASMLSQGGDIADGKVDPKTGKPKTFSLGAVATDAAIGGVTGLVGGPLIKAAFKAAPTVVGGAMALGVASGGKKAYDSYQEGNHWSALAEGGMTATAVLPFASKKNLSGMFGADARAQTMQTVRQGGSRLLSGAKDFGAQAWGGVKNLAASEGMAGVKALGRDAWSGARNLGTKAVTGVKNLGAQAWSGARDWGAKAWSGAKNLGDRAVIGAKNVGIRAANEQDNLIYQAKVLEAKMFPAMATPEGSPLRPMPEPPTQRPLIPVPEKQKPLMMETHNPEGGAPQSNKPGSPAKGEDYTPQTSQTTPENQPGRATSTQEQRTSQNKGFEDPKLTEHSQGIETTYGKNYIEKFGKHIEQMRRLTGADIGKKVKTSPETQQQVKNAIDDIIMTGEARTRPWGEYKDAIWSRKGDAIVIRQSNGEFVTFLDGTQPGNVQRWHD